MWPLVHPFFGYLVYSVASRAARGEAPTAAAAIAVTVGATVPDVVDQPLRVALAGHVGRSVGHSLLVAVPAAALAVLVARRRGRPRVGVAFAVGYLSHLLADALWPVLVGAYDELGYLLWPITTMPPYEGQKHLTTVAGLDVTTLWLEATLVVATVWLWLRDGAPGTDRP